jgi:RNA recognition motif-containing protein
MIKERKTGEPKGFAFVTMNEHGEADKAVSISKRIHSAIKN